MRITYDSLNRLATVVDNRLSGSNTTTYTYDDANNVATVTYPNNVQTTLTYDDLNRVTGLGSSLGNYTYQLGATGNRTSASEPNGRSVTWSYDGIYRLTNEAITGAPSGKNGTVAYGLDPVGNRTSASSSISGLAPVSGTFNSDDELASETYDQNGNVTSTGGKTFTYDAENHLLSMGSTVGLMYDGDGNRVAKSVSGATTYYLVDDLNPTDYPQVVEELNSGGAVTRQYTYGLQRISQQQAISSTWTPSFYGYDGGGSVRALTNAAGAVTDSYEYDGFGNHWTAEGSTPNNMFYRGEEWDPDLSLLYLRARYMNPLTGRFMSRDPDGGVPIDPRSLHEYLYAQSDPVDLADPLGRRAEPIPEPGPEPVPDPEPQPSRANSGAAVEYALIVGEISLGSVAGLKSVANEISCVFYGAASALHVTSLNLGLLQGLQISWSTCSAMSSRMPDTTRRGAVPSPIGYPNLEYFTQPGNKWGCSAAAADDVPTDCSAPCSNGNTETLHFDHGISNGKGAHWDFTDCERKTWYIWPDGTMTPAT